MLKALHSFSAFPAAKTRGVFIFVSRVFYKSVLKLTKYTMSFDKLFRLAY